MRIFHALRSLAKHLTMDISTTPAVGQRILHNAKEYTTIKEGLAHILIPASASTTPQQTPRGDNEAQSVFYNPIQQFNRDLSVLAIKAYGEEVVERKKKQAENNRKKFSEKKNEKKSLKRKAESVANQSASRKASKLDEGVDSPSIVAEDVETIAAKIEPANEPQNETSAAQLDETTSEVNPEKVVEETPAAPKANALPIPPSFTILDALSATGLRAVRYAHEIPFTTSVTANDLLPAATDLIKLNALHNKLDKKITAVTGNALTHMYSLVAEDTGKSSISKRYDVIDLDPYGTAAPFLDAAVQAVRNDGGLLCVTCTDAGVWASNGYPEKAYSLYGGVPIKGMHSHEGGLRLILHAIATSAARYGLAMEPLLSLSIDFYARVFVKIHKSASDVKFLAGKTMVVHNCDVGCGAWSTQMVSRNKIVPNKSGKGYFWKHTFEQATPAGECPHCNTRTHLAGPMYAGPIHCPKFIQRILDGLPDVSKDTYQTTARIEGMLSVALEETLPPLDENKDSPTATSKTKRYDPAIIDHYPFLFIPSVLSKIIHCVTPHENAIRGALRHLGYRVTRSHTKAGSIKTDAPWEVIWEIMREWVKQKAPVKEGAVRPGTAGWRILRLEEKSNVELPGEKTEEKTEEAKEAEGKEEVKKSKIVFDESLGREKDDRKLVRYQHNPRENWGPMGRANGHS